MCNFTIINENSSHSPSRMSHFELFGIFKKAAKLTKDPCNGCRTVVSQRHFALSPRYLGRLKKGAMETLVSEIGRYSESLAGVPLAYCNLTLLQQTGNILDDQPFIHFNVSFKAVIFQPSIGSILKCVVNELSMDHVSCLVHNWFNLSLPLRGADAEERLPKGSKVMAKVTKIQAKNGILAIQGTPTEDRFSDLPLVDPLKEELSDDEGAEMESETPKKVKHDSGFISDPENSLGLPLESTSENDGENVGKEKQEREVEDEQEMEEDVLGLTEGEGREGKKKKKKKKEEMMEKEMIDSLGKISIKKEAEGSPDESYNDNDVAEDGLIGEQTTEKKKKKKRKSTVESDSPAQESSRVKPEVVDEEESIQDVNRSSKKKKKHKERESESLDDHGVKEEVEPSSGIRIKDEPESDEEQTSDKKVKRKKHKKEDQASETDGVSEEQNGKQKQLKRKHSDVNGGGDHSERTTQNEVYGTEEDIDVPVIRKKKKKKHIKEEDV